MLLNLIEHLHPSEPLSSNVTGTIVGVDAAMGRVKMIIKGYYEGSKENLPWIYPKNPPDQGGQQDASHQQMPDLFSTLMVSFPTADIHHGQYDGKHSTPQASQSIFQKNDVPMDEDSGSNPAGQQGDAFGQDTPSGGNQTIDFTTQFGKIWKSTSDGDKSWERHDKERGVTERYHGKSKHYHRTEVNTGNQTHHFPGRKLTNVGPMDDDQSGNQGGGQGGQGGQGGGGGGDQQSKDHSHNINVPKDDHIVHAKNIVFQADESIYFSTPNGDVRFDVKNFQAKTAKDVSFKSGQNIILGASSGNITGKSKKTEWKGDTVSVDSSDPKVKTAWQTGSAGIASDPADPDMKVMTDDIKKLTKMVTKLQKQIKSLDKQHTKNKEDATQEVSRLQSLVAQIGQGDSVG
jgi:hypothetical protein